MIATLRDRLRPSIKAAPFVSLHDPRGAWFEERLKSDGAPLDFRARERGSTCG